MKSHSTRVSSEMKQLSYPRTSSNFGNSFVVTKALRLSRTEQERCVSSFKLKRCGRFGGGGGGGGREGGRGREGEGGRRGEGEGRAVMMCNGLAGGSYDV